MNLTKLSSHGFGVLPSGQSARLFTLENSDISVSLTDFGARVVSLLTRDREGSAADIALGYTGVQEYATASNAYLGATIGRYGNRIACGRFSIDGKQYEIPANNGANALHGGPSGFDLRMWDARLLDDGVEFSLTSQDGDQGFPGTLRVKALFRLSGDSLTLSYEAETMAATIVNLTNHTYFNLEGEGSVSLTRHVLDISAEEVVEINESLIPTGKLMRVQDTPLEFTSTHEMMDRIGEPHPQLLRAGGYDHTFVLRGETKKLNHAARVQHLDNGRTLDVWTTEPGVQFYSGNFLDGALVGKSGKPYAHRSAFCLETQHFPDSPNHSNFPSTLLRPGQVYSSETVWIFNQQ